MSERPFRHMPMTELPPRPRIPEVEEFENDLFKQREDLGRAKKAMEELLAADQLNIDHLEQWIKIWNNKESSQRGFEGPVAPLSDNASTPQKHGRLSFYRFPQTGAIKIGYKRKQRGQNP